MTAKPSIGVQRFSWCLFDFANSAFNTIVLTFVYSRFFSGVLVGDQAVGDVYWAGSLVVCGLVVAVLSPFLGAAADRSASKKRYLIITALITIACTALLYWPSVAAGATAATGPTIAVALLLVTVAGVAFEIMFVFYNAFLPGLGDQAILGRISGYGWAFGYLGGLLCLGLCLGCIGVGDLEPWVTTEGDAHKRLTNLIVAGWFLVFALPMFVLVKDNQPAVTPEKRERSGRFGAGKEVLQTLRSLRRHPDLLRLLLARLFYNDALVALIGLSGLYMAGTLEMGDADVLVMAIGLNIAAGVGALGFGYVDDFLGSKTAVVGSLLLLIVGAITALAVPTVPAFAVAAVLIGIGMGPNQAASRTMLARFVPVEKSTEFYGLFALSGKATVWIGPLLFGAVRRFADDQRLAMIPLVGMFVLGLVLLLGVDERRGIAAAESLTTAE